MKMTAEKKKKNSSKQNYFKEFFTQLIQSFTET